MSTSFDIKSQTLSNLFRIEFMFMQEKIMFLGFFILKFLKSETLLVLLTEAKNGQIERVRLVKSW